MSAADLTKGKQPRSHAGKDSFSAWRKVEADETVKCRVIRGRHAFQEVHKIDVGATSFFHTSGRVDALHIRIENDLKELTRGRLIFSDSAISRIEI